MSSEQDHYFLNDQRGLSLFKNLEVGGDPRFMIETHVAAVDRSLANDVLLDHTHKAKLKASLLTDDLLIELAMGLAAMKYEH